MVIKVSASVLSSSPEFAAHVREEIGKCGVALDLRQTTAELAELRGGSDVLLAFPEGLDISPQLLTERARVLGNLPVVIITSQPDLEHGAAWYALGAYDYVGTQDTERLALVLQRAVQKQRTEWNVASGLLQTIIDAVPAPIFFKDADGRYLGCNQAFVESIGPSREEIVGKTVYDVAPKELADIYHQADMDLLAAGGEQVYENQARFSDGSLHEIMFHKAVFNHLDGTPGGQVGVMLDITERKRLEAELERLATLDPLTEAYNRRSFMQLAEAECSRARRHNRPLSLAVIDIDHFKQVNDNFGHAAGDDVLIQLVRTAKRFMRQHDVFARAGGEEFFVLFSETACGEAVGICERLCQDISSQAIQFDGHEIAVTVSAGVAECDPESESIDACLRTADKAMYAAKRQGRNRVIAAPAADSN